MVTNNKDKKILKDAIDRLAKRLQKTESRLARKNKQMMDILSEKKISAQRESQKKGKVQKELQKTQIRLAKKNQKMMELNSLKKETIAELEDLRLQVRDLKYLLDQKDTELKHVKTNFSTDSDLELKKLSEEKEYLNSELEKIRIELQKKDAIIELLQKPEYDYQGIVSFDVERVKAKWIGWGEGANLEEIDFYIVNNSEEDIKNLIVDVYIEDESGNIYKHDGYKIRQVIRPKEKVARKMHMFKQLKKRGSYKVEVRVFKSDHSKELAEKTKVMTI